jgi:hypothetical protein
MPRGPKGEKRPADVIGATVMVGKIATGDKTATTEDGKNAAAWRWGAWAGMRRFTRLTNAFAKKVGKPLSRACALFHVLQFLPHP